MNRKCEQSVTTDERRTFTKVLGADKDEVHRDQTVGNDNKDAMLDCKSGFHPSEDKLKRNNCHIYVTSIMIITFLMFLLKQSTLSAVIFLFVPLGLSLSCVYYHRLTILFCVVDCALNGFIGDQISLSKGDALGF